MQVGDAPLVDPADVPPPGAGRVKLVRADVVEDVIGVSTKTSPLSGPARPPAGGGGASATSPCRVTAALEQTPQAHAQSGPQANPRGPRSLLDARLQRILEPRFQKLARGQHGRIDNADGRPRRSRTRARASDVAAAAAGGGGGVGRAVAAVAVAEALVALHDEVAPLGGLRRRGAAQERRGAGRGPKVDALAADVQDARHGLHLVLFLAGRLGRLRYDACVAGRRLGRTWWRRNRFALGVFFLLFLPREDVERGAEVEREERPGRRQVLRGLADVALGPRLVGRDRNVAALARGRPWRLARDRVRAVLVAGAAVASCRGARRLERDIAARMRRVSPLCTPTKGDKSDECALPSLLNRKDV